MEAGMTDASNSNDRNHRANQPMFVKERHEMLSHEFVNECRFHFREILTQANVTAYCDTKLPTVSVGRNSLPSLRIPVFDDELLGSLVDAEVLLVRGAEQAG